MFVRKVTRGIAIGRIRIFWITKNWKRKEHPYWFARKYRGEDVWTVQCMRLEIWKRPF